MFKRSGLRRGWVFPPASCRATIRAMKYRRLGKTNLRVSVVGVGTWQFGGEWGKDFTQAEVDAIFDTARSAGINLIDTAECYGDHTSEAFVGNAIQRDRADWIVATKFGHKFHGYMNRTDERSAADAVTQVEDSLKALKTDYVDVLQYHTIRDSEFDNAELTAALEKLLKSGKVRHIGNSVGGEPMHQIDASASHHVELIQIIYNRLDRKPEAAALPSCIRQDLGVLARVPLASGLLSGKYKPGARFAEGDVRAGRKPEELDAKLREVEQIRSSELPAGENMATWALAWCLQHPAVTSVIPGCKDPQQVLSNAAAADLAIVKDDHRLAMA
jgi:aryl-alcohol dehydrogenase-like predicted oxidoreductase